MSNETIPESGAESGPSDRASATATGDGTSAAPPDHARTASVAEKGAHRSRSKTKPKPIITSIEELLTFAYESKARQLEFSKEDLKQLAITDEGLAPQSALVGSLAPTDPTLSTPFKLLQYAARQGVPLKRSEDGDLARALNRLVDLAVVALGHSPLFRVWVDQLVDPRKDPQLPTEHLRDEALQISADRLGLTPKQFKAADRERLLKNAIACYGLLRTLQREWTLDQFIDASYDSVWRHEAPKAARLERVAGEVGASSDLNVLGIVGENYLARIARLERQVTQLEREADAASNRETRLREELSAVRESEQSAMARADALSADVVRLQKELAAERDNRVVDKSHMADDYETLRTRIIRRLGGEIDLLTDGLHALRNGAPNVAEEFLDRSLLALTREVEQLKDASGGFA